MNDKRNMIINIHPQDVHFDIMHLVKNDKLGKVENT